MSKSPRYKELRLMIQSQPICNYCDQFSEQLVMSSSTSEEPILSSEKLGEPVFFYQQIDREGRFKEELKRQIGKECYEWLGNYIQENGAKNYLEAKRSQELLIDSSNTNQLLWTPSGQVYLKIGKLGKGCFKTTIKTVLVASLQEDKLQDHLKYRALSQTTRPIEKEEWVDVENERMINCYLKQQAKVNNLSHVNVPKSVSAAHHQYFALAMEVFDGTLENVMNKPSSLSWKNRLSIASQMAQAIAQLHAIQIIHRDIKLDNFLYNFDPNLEQYLVKITDFGVSSKTEEGERSPNYKFFNRIIEPSWHVYDFPFRRFEFSSDLYQLGIALFQLFTGTSLTKWIEQQNTYIDHQRGLDPSKKMTLSQRIYKWKCDPESKKQLEKIKHPEIRKLISNLLSLSALKRPSAQQVHEFFKDVFNKYALDPQESPEWQCVHVEELKKDGLGVGFLGVYIDPQDSSALKPCHVD